MTDWDPACADADTAKGAFVTFCACALVFLISKPLDLYARLSNRRSATADDGCEGADWGCEGSFETHNGGRQ